MKSNDSVGLAGALEMVDAGKPISLEMKYSAVKDMARMLAENVDYYRRNYDRMLELLQCQKKAPMDHVRISELLKLLRDDGVPL